MMFVVKPAPRIAGSWRTLVTQVWASSRFMVRIAWFPFESAGITARWESRDRLTRSYGSGLGPTKNMKNFSQRDEAKQRASARLSLSIGLGRLARLRLYAAVLCGSPPWTRFQPLRPEPRSSQTGRRLCSQEQLSGIGYVIRTGRLPERISNYRGMDF